MLQISLILSMLLSHENMSRMVLCTPRLQIESADHSMGPLLFLYRSLTNCLFDLLSTLRLMVILAVYVYTGCLCTYWLSVYCVDIPSEKVKLTWRKERNIKWNNVSPLLKPQINLQKLQLSRRGEGPMQVAMHMWLGRLARKPLYNQGET